MSGSFTLFRCASASLLLGMGESCIGALPVKMSSSGSLAFFAWSTHRQKCMQYFVGERHTCSERVRHAFALVWYKNLREVRYGGIGEQYIAPVVCDEVFEVFDLLESGVGRAHRERKETSGAVGTNRERQRCSKVLLDRKTV
jgi:hypothetical protein